MIGTAIQETAVLHYTTLAALDIAYPVAKIQSKKLWKQVVNQFLPSALKIGTAKGASAVQPYNQA